ncbi:hypothetical protein ILUMI_14189, partial [Ignelater luminosus]
HDLTSFKPELLELANTNKKKKVYKVNELIKRHGHEVLRLAPYHCDFNAIELVWTQAKKYYYDHIGSVGFQDEKVVAMWKEALNHCNDELWQHCVNHTEDIIKAWYTNANDF